MRTPGEMRRRQHESASLESSSHAREKQPDDVIPIPPWRERELLVFVFMGRQAAGRGRNSLRPSGYRTLPGHHPKFKRSSGSVAASTSDRRDDLDAEPAPNRAAALVQRQSYNQLAPAK